MARDTPNEGIFTFGKTPSGFVGPTMPAVGAPTASPAPTPAPAPVKSTPTVAKKTITNRVASPAVGSSNTGVISPTAPVAPNVDEWLANDVAYKSQSDQLQKAWADYQAQSRQGENQYRTDYTAKLNELDKSREIGQKELESDYAARGMIGSGLYTKAFTDFSNDYDNRQKNLDTGLSDFLANLLTQSQNYKSEQEIAAEKAKQDAIARRAATLGI